MAGIGLSIGVDRSGVSVSRLPGVRNFTVSNVSNSITLMWAAPSSGTPTSYQAQLSLDGLTWGSQQSVSPPTATYTYSGLSAGTYFVRVRVVYASGNSGWTQSGEILIVSFINTVLTEFFLVI